MIQEKILVKVHGSCNQNPHGEMQVAYIIEFQDSKLETYVDFIDAKRGNTMNTAEYMALNIALERLLELNKTKSMIEINTTSQLIALHKLGYMKPNGGYYVDEAVKVIKNLKRFTNLSITKVHRRDNIEVVNLLKRKQDLYPEN
jgi:ribonuclease HI